MKRTSDVTILGTVVYGVSISTITFTLRSRTSLGSTQMNNQSKASKSDLPRSLEMKKIFNGCLLHGCVRHFWFGLILRDTLNSITPQNHPPPATDSGRTVRTPLYPPVQAAPHHYSNPPFFFPVPDRGTGEGRYLCP